MVARLVRDFFLRGLSPERSVSSFSYFSGYGLTRHLGVLSSCYSRIMGGVNELRDARSLRFQLLQTGGEWNTNVDPERDFAWAPSQLAVQRG